MATKKDLVEAYSFSRRRLVTAFVSGAPGGREVEPTRPGRAIVGGIALAILLVAGGAVAGVFKARPDEDWRSTGLVISKEEDQYYVIINNDDGEDPELRPVSNITSAQLILGADNSESREVPEEQIQEEERGAPIGILEAPATVPSTSNLIQDEWTACTGDRMGVRANAAEDPQVEQVAAGGGLVLKNDGVLYLIAEETQLDREAAHAYALGKKNPDNILGALKLPFSTEGALRVNNDFLTLFPQGAALQLESFGIGKVGKPVEYAGRQGIPVTAKLGDFYTQSGAMLVLTDEGPAQFSDFAFAVYRGLTFPKKVEPPGELTLVETPTIDVVPADYEKEAHWPDSTLAQIDGQACAQLSLAVGESPTVQLVQLPQGDASAEEVAADERDPLVDSGKGAFVLSGGWDSTVSGSPVLIDDRGFSHSLVGAFAVGNLGYDVDDAPVVNDTWIELFKPGVALSRDAALCPPARGEAQQCE
ncbi:MAG: type VII secretion protein EccB [Nocardioides sp.]